MANAAWSPDIFCIYVICVKMYILPEDDKVSENGEVKEGYRLSTEFRLRPLIH